MPTSAPERPAQAADWFDTTGLENGNYANPRDCTRYICVTEGRADDLSCHPCDQDSVEQCAGEPYLIWDDDVKRCEYPATTTCHQPDAPVCIDDES